MRVLIACEESQRVCIAFREQGHEAYSCDIQDQSGGHPEWHIMQSVIPLLNGNCEFETTDGQKHKIAGKWDLIIAHPPCTYLANCGNRYLNIEKYGKKAIARYESREEAAWFFMKFIQADCDKICVENPVGYMSTYFEKPTQIIQPYYFGDRERKATCLWLKGLPKLRKTNVVEPKLIYYKTKQGTDPMWHYSTLSLPEKERRKVRSKTFWGVAKAMASQWGEIGE